MYENPATQENMRKLLGFGYHFVEPRESLLACGDMGRGALADLDVIVAAVRKLLEM
jgi:phosphopantothenoylcysteine synthetase/decarboxylase